MKTQDSFDKQAICRLCDSKSKLFHQSETSRFFKCPTCKGIFVDSSYLLDAETEEERYQAHNNDTTDPRYRKFVSPITDAVQASFRDSHLGLDFGCGSGPVITEVLREKGYQINTYDPFFDYRPEVLNEKYHFIACCEVAEHFHQPAKEFKLLKKLLHPKGSLFIMTDLFKGEIDFAEWYYKNDPTHVFFYQNDTFEWICKHFDFEKFEISGRLTTLYNK